MKFLNKIDGADKIVTDSSNRFVTDAEKSTWNGKVDASQVLTDVPANAVFTDTNTVTSINGKTGAITKADVVALGIPSQDTVYTHPASHPASMITGLPTSLPADGGDADTVNGKTVGVSVPVGAKFTDTNTVTTINGKTGVISKADIVALGIPAQDTVYSHPTTAGNKHIPSGGASNQVLKYSADGTAVWGTDTNTVTSINGKTGTISKADIVALGIPAQDTVVDISGKADKTYVDNKVKTDVPVGAEFTDTVYTHPTTAGNKHIPTAGATSNFLIYGGASGTASWSAMSDTLHGTRGGGTQHSVATTSANGFMSGTDKTKLDGIDAGANKITLGTTQPTVGWWFKEIT